MSTPPSSGRIPRSHGRCRVCQLGSDTATTLHTVSVSGEIANRLLARSSTPSSNLTI